MSFFLFSKLSCFQCNRLRGQVIASQPFGKHTNMLANGPYASDRPIFMLFIAHTNCELAWLCSQWMSDGRRAGGRIKQCTPAKTHSNIWTKRFVLWFNKWARPLTTLWNGRFARAFSVRTATIWKWKLLVNIARRNCSQTKATSKQNRDTKKNWLSDI